MSGEQGDTLAITASSFVPRSLRAALAARGVPDSGAVVPLGHAALLWTDLQQFSNLSNRLVAGGTRGIEQLHQILSAHYDQLLSTVDRFGGEPLLFAGDALLCAWSGGDPGLASRRAVACAQRLLAHHRLIDERGDVVGMHLFVAAGGFGIADVGTAQTRLSVPFGDALVELEKISGLRAPGAVIVTLAVAEAIGVACSPLGVGATIDASIPTPELELTAASVAVELDACIPYLPPAVRAHLGTSLSWVAELRRVSVVFAQLPNLARAGEEAIRVLQQVAAVAASAAARHEATLAQITIDDKGASVLLDQGVPPQAHPDDPDRAVSLAVDLRDALAAIGQRCRIGVTTGSAYCGLIGDPRLRYYMVIGSHVNLAARLMMASEDAILCDAPSVRSARATWQFEPRPAVHAKGHDAPIPVWVPTGRIVKTAAASVELVGRASELGRLRDALAEVIGGAARGVLIKGSAGVGKSSLLNRFVDECIAAGLPVFRGQGVRVATNAAWHAWRPLFEEMLRLQDSTSLESRRAAALESLGDLGDRAALLNGVIPLDLPDSPRTAELSPAQRAEATELLLVELLARRTQGAVVVVLEDAQWLDPASWALAAAVLDRLTGALLLASSRPFAEPPALAARMVCIDLDGLDEQGQHDLLRARLGVLEVEPALRRFLAERSHGHPFFLTELVRVLHDSGSIVVHDGRAQLASGRPLEVSTIPDTIQGLVLQRLDRMQTGPQLALKVSSAIGLRFATTVVADVHPERSEGPRVPAHLLQASRQGLMQPALVNDTDGYMFQHELTREVAYGLMPSGQRAALHRSIAEWIEENRGEEVNGRLVTLAYHWEHAGEVERAVDYLEREAARAFSVGLAATSVAVGLRAAALLGVVLPTDPAEIGPQIGANMGAVMQAMAGRTPMDLLDLPPLSDPKLERLLWLLPRVGPFTFQTQQIELFALMAVTGLRLTIEHGNGPPTADVYSMYSAVHRGLTGDRVAAHAWSELALAMDARNGHTVRSRVAFVHTWFHAHWVQPLADSPALAQAAAEAGLAVGDVLFGCFNLSAHVVYLAATGRPLAEVCAVARDHLERNGRRVINAVFHLVHELQLAKAFMGLTPSLLSLSDAEFDEERDLRSICATEFANQTGYYLVSRVKLHVHAGDWSGALEFAAAVQPLIPAFEGQVAEFELVQYHAVALLQAAIAASDAAAALLAAATVLVETMERWAVLVPANYGHKAALLRALLAAAAGRFEPAAFVRAGDAALAGGWSQDAGLAHECRVRVHLARGERDAAREAARPALAAYERWGAAAKLAQILELIA